MAFTPDFIYKVILVIPFFLALIFPFEETEAILGLLDFHLEILSPYVLDFIFNV